jgi:excisionase family DNA binding protein
MHNILQNLTDSAFPSSVELPASDGVDPEFVSHPPSATTLGPRPPCMQIPEIAKRLGVGRLKVYAMLEAGVIPGIRFGHKWIVTRYAYLNWEKTCGTREASLGRAAKAALQ